MTFDGFFTRALVNELAERLIGGRISKIYQPFERELQIVIRNQRQNYRLSASIHPTYYHLGLTDERPSNPTHAPMFCMLMRKHLENAIVLDLRQVDNDRIIEMELSGLDELGDKQTYRLIFEMMGRHSNILLVNPKKETIIDCIKHVAPSLNTYRGLQPGALYVTPPKNSQQTNIFTINHLEQWANAHQDILANGQGHRIIEGLGILGSRQLAEWIATENVAPADALRKLMEATSNVSPTLYESSNRLNFYFMRLPHLEGEQTRFDTLSELVQVFFQQKIHQDRIKQLSGDLTQKLEHIIQRNQTKLIKLEEDRKVAIAAEMYRIKGELLTSYAYQIEKGVDSVTVENYYDDNHPITIALDSRLSPIENSQQYFRRYTKYRDSLHYIDEQVTLATQENDYLEGILVQLQQADIEDIEDIKAELSQEGYVSQRKSSIKKRAKSTSSPRIYQSEDGVRIYVGRNNQQNDELSLKKAAKNHWWLHAKNIPGSHVIIESDKPSDETITLAAELAAFYSKFSQSAQVPVDLLQVKHLRKPNGAKPGYVIYEGQNTVYVTPDAEKLKQYEVK
ncbi:NFACT family protein [Tuanshanicoccus lijuaniae]|uniref:Rqc2 family fibronectin-binding protein n=1 Tax=Aerococcaceae bacterium zg-1292 TaxID=2774330 RepID=UPI001935695E|nr:NFACT family protein [Aerococcaceae bacterium zg-1292]QQA36275.1 NFACT family protein [Aerococcaceae bacterium zg-1292]